MRPRAAIVAVALLLSALSFAQDLEQALNQQYKDHTYTLRQPMTAPTQQYDSLGNSPTASALGPWTIYGRLQIKRIKLEPHRLTVEGRRVGMKFDPRVGVLVPVTLKDIVRLEIAVNQPPESGLQFHTILSHIFAFSKEDFLASLPEFWRSYAQVYLNSYADDGETIKFKTSGEVTLERPKEPGVETVPGLAAAKAQHHRVTAPQPRRTPDPSFTKAATTQGLFGTIVLTAIVDEIGKMADVRLVRPLGLGLDESAATTVETWIFKPGTKDGRPVKVFMTVELEFHSYQ